MTNNNPSSDDTATMICPIDGTVFTPSGRRRYCSDRCRRTAWTRRHHQPTPVIVAPPPGPRRPIAVYECETCGTTALGSQRCDDCGTFMRRVGLGGLCPHCDEPLAATELIDTTEPRR